MHGASGRNRVRQILVRLLQLHKIGDVQEGVALQANVDKSRLHAGQHARHAAFVDGPGEGVFIFALEVDFREQIVFHEPHLGFVRGRRDK